MKKVILSVISILLPLAVVAYLAFSTLPVYAVDSLQSGANAARGSGQPTELFGDSGIITTITNLLLYIIGILSVVMLIIGGLRYVVSGGNATAVTAAKNTILYAIVGLIIAILAYAIIHFIIGAISGGGMSGGGTNV